MRHTTSAAGRDSRREYDKAIADFGEAIRLDPKRADAYVGRAGAHESKGEYDEAVADCSEAIRLDPKLALGHSSRGLAPTGSASTTWRLRT